MSDALQWKQVEEVLLRYLAVRQMSSSTVKSYRNALETFDSFLVGQGIRDYREVTEETAGAYVLHIRSATYGSKNRPYSYTAIRKKIGCIRTLFRLLVKEELIFSDPFGRIEYAKKPQALPRRVLSKEEISRLFSLPNLDTYVGYRDRTVLELLYGTGMRLGELVKLDIEDIDFGERLIFIRQGKGKKDRIVPCTRSALAYVQEYLKAVRPALCFMDTGTRALFLTLRGVRLTATAFRSVFRILIRKAGITGRVSPHCLRHTFATHLLECGASVRYIQEILGHEQLSTTAVYTRVSTAVLQKMLRSFHPLENGLLEEEPEAPTKYTRNRHTGIDGKRGGE